MKLKKIFQYGFIALCLLGNAIGMDNTCNLPNNAILRHQSLCHIKAASETARAESREFHIMLGANPSEEHVVQLRAAEEKREQEEGVKAPIRLFFVNACGEQISSAKTPILNADFNKIESWDTILEALMLGEKKFNGVVDKIYFDVSTSKFARWDEGILAKIAILLKESFELYIPNAKLSSESRFCDSDVDRVTYAKLTKFQKHALPFPPSDAQLSLFFKGGCMVPTIRRDGIYYNYNALGLVYNTIFQFSGLIDRPLKFESFEGDDIYPDIGMKYRTESEEIIENSLRINSFVKVTLEAEKEKFNLMVAAAKESVIVPQGLEVFEKIEGKISIESETKAGDEPSPIATSTEITIENKDVINEATDEPSPIAAISDISMEKEGALNEAVLALSPKAASKEAPIPDGYKAVKFPSLNKIKEGLRQGRSPIYSETHDAFYVQSIMGSFFGFTPEAQAKDFDLKMKCMSTSQDCQGSYGLFGVFKIMFEDSNGIGVPILLKSDRKESPYIVEGGAQKKESFYLVSDPEELQIIAPIKKREAEKKISKAPNKE